MPIQGKWFVTPHATRRFQELAELESYNEAFRQLVEFSEKAYIVKRLDTGRRLFRVNGPVRWRFVVGDPDPDAGRPLPTLVTVKPEHDGQYPEARRRGT